MERPVSAGKNFAPNATFTKIPAPTEMSVVKGKIVTSRPSMALCKISIISASDRAFALESMGMRSEEPPSDLQSPCNLVCRLLLEKQQNYRTHNSPTLRTIKNTHVDAHDCRH